MCLGANLSLLLALHPFNNIAGPNDLWARSRVGGKGLGQKHANLFLVHGILSILASRDELSEPSRTLEEEDQGGSAGESVAVNILGCEATPLVQHKPNHLLCSKVGMSAVSPETRSVKTTVKLRLGVHELLGDLGLGLVLMLGRVVVYTMVRLLNIKAHEILTPLLTIANPLAVD